MTNDQATPRLEYALGLLGAALVLAALAFVGYQGITARGSDPQLVVSVLRIDSSGGQHTVQYRVSNNGGSTAEQVHVVGELVVDGQTQASVSSTVAYVPAGSSRSGALIFSKDPSAASLQVRATSYARS